MLNSYFQRIKREHRSRINRTCKTTDNSVDTLSSTDLENMGTLRPSQSNRSRISLRDSMSRSSVDVARSTSRSRLPVPIEGDKQNPSNNCKCHCHGNDIRTIGALRSRAPLMQNRQEEEKLMQEQELMVRETTENITLTMMPDLKLVSDSGEHVSRSETEEEQSSQSGRPGDIQAINKHLARIKDSCREGMTDKTKSESNEDKDKDRKDEANDISSVGVQTSEVFLIKALFGNEYIGKFKELDRNLRRRNRQKLIDKVFSTVRFAQAHPYWFGIIMMFLALALNSLMSYGYCVCAKPRYVESVGEFVCYVSDWIGDRLGLVNLVNTQYRLIYKRISENLSVCATRATLVPWPIGRHYGWDESSSSVPPQHDEGPSLWTIFYWSIPDPQ